MLELLYVVRLLLYRPLLRY